MAKKRAKVEASLKAAEEEAKRKAESEESGKSEEPTPEKEPPKGDDITLVPGTPKPEPKAATPTPKPPTPEPTKTPEALKPRVALRVFAAAGGIRWDQMRGFASHAKRMKLGPLTIQEWRDAYQAFLGKPTG